MNSNAHQLHPILGNIRETAMDRWLKPKELEILLDPDQTPLTVIKNHVRFLPPSGSLFLFDRNVSCNFYKKDGYDWVKKKKSSLTVREDHVKLKINGKNVIAGVYCFSKDLPGLQRRAYHLLDPDTGTTKDPVMRGLNENLEFDETKLKPSLVLLHYLDINEASRRTLESYDYDLSSQRIEGGPETKRTKFCDDTPSTKAECNDSTSMASSMSSCSHLNHNKLRQIDVVPMNEIDAGNSPQNVVNLNQNVNINLTNAEMIAIENDTAVARLKNNLTAAAIAMERVINRQQNTQMMALLGLFQNHSTGSGGATTSALSNILLPGSQQNMLDGIATNSLCHLLLNNNLNQEIQGNFLPVTSNFASALPEAAQEVAASTLAVNAAASLMHPSLPASLFPLVSNMDNTSANQAARLMALERIQKETSLVAGNNNGSYFNPVVSQEKRSNNTPAYVPYGTEEEFINDIKNVFC